MNNEEKIEELIRGQKETNQRLRELTDLVSALVITATAGEPLKADDFDAMIELERLKFRFEYLRPGAKCEANSIENRWKLKALLKSGFAEMFCADDLWIQRYRHDELTFADLRDAICKKCNSKNGPRAIEIYFERPIRSAIANNKLSVEDLHLEDREALNAFLKKGKGARLAQLRFPSSLFDEIHRFLPVDKSKGAVGDDCPF